MKPISAEQEELIHRLVYFQNEYEQPSEEDLKRISVSIHLFLPIGAEKLAEKSGDVENGISN